MRSAPACRAGATVATHLVGSQRPESASVAAETIAIPGKPANPHWQLSAVDMGFRPCGQNTTRTRPEEASSGNDGDDTLNQHLDATTPQAAAAAEAACLLNGLLIWPPGVHDARRMVRYLG